MERHERVKVTFRVDVQRRNEFVGRLAQEKPESDVAQTKSATSAKVTAAAKKPKAKTTKVCIVAEFVKYF